jgi:hypothetical protein
MTRRSVGDFFIVKMICDIGVDTKVAGTDYHATGDVACSMGGRAATGMCPFGVKREGYGSGIVTMTKPDGRTRSVFFRDGKSISYDFRQADPGEFRASRQGALYIVRIGMERHEFPEAAIYGG